LAQDAKPAPRIHEQYISVHALPNEPINAWLKWDEGFQFDNLILRSDNDVYIPRLTNVMEEVWASNPDHYGGLFLIDSKYLEVDGFVGFQGHFTSIPDSDKKISFYIDFVRNNERVHQVELTTTVIVPGMRVRSDSDLNLMLSEDMMTQELSLDLTLEKIGTALVKDLDMFINIHKESENLRLDIYTETQKEPALSSAGVRSHIKITGSGYAVVKMGFVYKDVLNNKYRTNTVELILTKRVLGTAEIPVRSRLEADVPLIVARA
jgi:hypothetical protein